MKRIALLFLLTLVLCSNGFTQGNKIEEHFILTEMYCVNESYSIENNLATNFPARGYIMWITTDSSNIFSAFIPLSDNMDDDIVIAFGKFNLSDCDLTINEEALIDVSATLFGKGKIISSFFEERPAEHLIISKMEKTNPEDPYQYVCFTLVYWDSDHPGYMLQMYGKTMELKHEF